MSQHSTRAFGLAGWLVVWLAAWPQAAEAACPLAGSVQCGKFVFGDTNKGSYLLDSSPCAPPGGWAAEQYWQFQAPAPGTYVFVLAAAGKPSYPSRLLILTNCENAATCVKTVKTQPSSSETHYTAVLPEAKTYTLVVDGLDPAVEQGPYELFVASCPAGKEAACTDGKDDDGDGKTDCADADCTGQTCADDGIACTDDACSAELTCSHPAKSGSCDDGNGCTLDVCDAAKGCVNPPLDGQTCGAGNPCTGADKCQAGQCVAGAVKECPNDGNPCTQDVCVTGTGACGLPIDGPCSDGDACTTTDTCASGKCVPGKEVACTVLDVPCKIAICNPKTGSCDAQDAPAGTACNDQDACTDPDACDAQGACKGTPVECKDDGKPCTEDACKDGACYAKLTGPACDDGNACTPTSKCNDGVCEGTPISCTAPADTCKISECNPKTGDCETKAKPLGAACTDFDKCTEPDQCTDKGCQGQGSLDCNDKLLCTVDSCDVAKGCENTLDLSLCQCNAKPGGSFQAKLDLSFPYQVACPVFGGKVGAELAVQGGLASQVPDCSNGCKGKTEAKLGAKVTLGLCKGGLDEFNGDAFVGYLDQRQHCKDCALPACEETCNQQQFCRDRTIDLGAALGVSKTWGWEFGKQDILGMDLTLLFKCGLTLAAQLGFEGQHHLLEDHTQGTGCLKCQECEEVKAKAKFSVTPTAGCAIAAKAYGKGFEPGCKECAKLELGFAGTLERKCDGMTCVGTEMSAGFTYETPGIDFDLGPIGGLALGCGGGVQATCSNDTCGGAGCTEPEGTLIECTVSRSGALDSALSIFGL